MNTRKDKELERVLGNPENLIMSEEISDILAVEEDPASDLSVKINNRTLLCDIEEISVAEELFDFTLLVPALTTEDLLSNSEPIDFFAKGLHYKQILGSSIKWKNGNLLTIKSRRIFNEEV